MISDLYKVILFWNMKLFYQYLINFKDNFYKILIWTTGIQFKKNHSVYSTSKYASDASNFTQT